MGYSISAFFRPHAQHSAAFWWPLLFEALRRHGLHFDDPGRLPERLGRYLATDELSDSGFQRVSFRALWERLSDASSRYHDIVAFRTHAFPDWELNVSVRDGEGADPRPDVHASPDGPTLVRCWTHALAEDGSLEALEVAEDRLALLVAVACEVAELCAPGTGELTYERYGVLHRFGAIGQPLVLSWWGSPTQKGTFEAPITHATLPGGQAVTVTTRLQDGWSPGPIAVRLPIGASPLPDAHDGSPI